MTDLVLFQLNKLEERIVHLQNQQLIVSCEYSMHVSVCVFRTGGNTTILYFHTLHIHYIVSRAVANGPAGPVLAGPVFTKYCKL